jgi:nucleosome binding factor SPN SPT16 subunit
LNFHIPGGSTLQFPVSKEPNGIFVKELTLKNQSLKSGGENHLITASKQIKDLIKKVKDMDAEQEGAKGSGMIEQTDKGQEDLVTIKGKKEVLENLVIRPNIIGKKTLGNLEIHQNGVRFSSQKGHTVDVLFSNVKHAFFQPCAENELIVIIHFHLKTPVLVGTKKFQDVQFFKEAGVAADDLDNKQNRKRLTDMDELEQEERERQQKIKLNNKFANFVKLIEQQSERQRHHRIEFDIPIEDLDFYGCPHKSVVSVRPTKNCLIAISELPVFVIDINDIETVHFERVQFGIKNFDMAIIFKDFTTFKRINSIPIEHIENIKDYLDEIGVIYSESVVPMNWTNVLQQIREDFEDFLEQGAWKFLQDDGESEGEEGAGSEDEDEDFSEDEEGEEEDESESDYSDEDDEYSSSFEEEEALSEEGLSWDEMERQAEEEDRRAVTRRTGKEPTPVPSSSRHQHAGNNKRKPPTNGRR